MAFRRQPPPPPSDPPSVLLMHATGDRQSIEGGLIWVKIAALIEVGFTIGYLNADEDGAVGLSAKGQRWYERGRMGSLRSRQGRVGSMLRRD